MATYYRPRIDAAFALEIRERELVRQLLLSGYRPLDTSQLHWNYLLAGDVAPNHAPCAFFRRGHIEEIVCAAGQWTDNADVIARQPITRVQLTTRGDDLLQAGFYIDYENNKIHHARWPHIEFHPKWLANDPISTANHELRQAFTTWRRPQLGV